MLLAFIVIYSVYIRHTLQMHVNCNCIKQCNKRDKTFVWQTFLCQKTLLHSILKCVNCNFI